MIKIAYIVNNSAGVCYHRLEVPLSNLANEYPEDFIITEVNGFTDNMPDASVHILTSDFDVIIFNRYHFQPELIQKAKAAGIKIILDIDDFWHLPKHHIIYKDWVADDMPSKIIANLKLADAIWTTQHYLADKCLKHNKNVVVIPNAIDFTQEQFEPRKAERPGRFCIGWAGSAAHNKDIQMLATSLHRLHTDATFTGKYCMVMGGYSLDANYDKWQQYEKVFDNKADEGAYFRIMQANVYNYAGMYNYMDCALAPLVVDMFNNCKSNLKILEAGAFGLPVIVSPAEPYKEIVAAAGKFGLVAENEKHDWYKHISYMIRNPEHAKEMGANLHAFVKENYSIGKVNELRKQSLQNL